MSEFADPAKRLRFDFDTSFAQQRQIAPTPHLACLDLRTAGEIFTVRLDQVAAVYQGKPYARVPSSSPNLLGLCAFRGVLTPIYDLGAVLGVRTETRRSCLPYIIVAAYPKPIGFACEGLQAGLGAGQSVSPSSPPAQPLIDLVSIAKTIEQQISYSAKKE